MRDCLEDITTLSAVDLRESPDAYSEAMRHAYWEDRDLAGAIAISFAGISRLLAEAPAAGPERALELRSQAKRLTYDLASYTWPGWDEPGIIVTPPEMRAGYAAARANRRPRGARRPSDALPSANLQQQLALAAPDAQDQQCLAFRYLAEFADGSHALAVDRDDDVVRAQAALRGCAARLD